MKREATGNLFDEPAELPPIAPDAPLSERMGPRSLEEFVGQTDLVAARNRC